MADRAMRPTGLAQPWRKSLVVLHMVCGIGWMGLDMGSWCWRSRRCAPPKQR